MSETKPSEMRYRWVMLALVWMAYCTFGIIMRVISPLITQIIKDLNITYGQMGSILGSWQLTYTIVAVAMGFLLDRFGIRLTVGLGVIAITASAILRAFAVSYETLFLAVMIFGIGGPTISIGAPKLISVWFQGAERKKAAGIYTTGPSVGAIIAFSTVNSIVIPWLRSWRLTFLFFAAFAVAATILWWMFSREPSRSSAGSEAELSFKEGVLRLLRIKNVVIIIIVGLASFLGSHGITNWLPTIIEVSGQTAELAGYLSAIPNIATIVGALTIMRIYPEGKGRYVVAIIFLTRAISTYLIGVTTGVPLLAALFLQGIGTGAMTPLLMLIIMNTQGVGSRLMGTAGGLYFAVGEVGGFLGPYVMGLLTDLTGSFYSGITVFTILYLVMIPPLFLVKEAKSAES
ncbi:MAG: MFS transporter [archaeon]